MNRTTHDSGFATIREISAIRGRKLFIALDEFWGWGVGEAEALSCTQESY